MICPQCGNEVDENHKFCSKCGLKMDLSEMQKNDNNKGKFIGICIIIVLAVCGILFNYKSILSNYYLNQSNKVASFEEKANLLKKSMNYKVNDVNNKAIINLILSELNVNPSKSQDLLLSVKDLIDDDVFKKLYLNIQTYKSDELFFNHEYKKAAEAYASCCKYDINIINNSNYIEALEQYAEVELIKKEDVLYEDISNYYCIGDIDDDGVLEVAVFEKKPTISLDNYTASNIKLFKYLDNEYTLVSSVECPSETCHLGIAISKASKDVNGIFVSGAVGAHGGMQSLYILKDGKLTSALDEDIFSLYPSEIKDIDGDGIMELSHLDRNPNDSSSSNAECLKILTWYKWDGNKGLSTVKKQNFIE